VAVSVGYGKREKVNGELEREQGYLGTLDIEYIVDLSEWLIKTYF